MEFTKENILLDIEASSKDKLLHMISEYANQRGVVTNTIEVFDAFIKREDENSTGLQDGFAIPHAKCDGVVIPTVLYIRTKESIEWETFDESEVKHVFALLVPKKDSGTIHLVMLSKLATAQICHVPCQKKVAHQITLRVKASLGD